MILTAAALAALSSRPHAGNAPSAPGGISTVFQHLDSDIVSVPILDLQTATSTIEVAGAGHSVWDVDLEVWIDHDASEQLDLRLISPSGTEVVLAAHYPSENPDVFFPLKLDDQGDNALRDFPPSQMNPLGIVTPEGALSAFVGEEPNGTWTLVCADDAAGVEGSFVWSMQIVSLTGSSVPLPEQQVYEKLDPQPIDVGTVASTINAGGFAGSDLVDLDLRLSLTHPDPSSLYIWLSHDSMQTPLAIRAGTSSPDFFMDALFDDDAPLTIAAATATPVDGATPDGALARWNGLVPAGNWTLLILDLDGGGGGTFYGWELTFTTARSQPAAVAFCDGQPGQPCPCGNNGAPDHGCAGPFGSDGIRLAMELPNGLARLGDDDVALVADELEPFQICLFLQSSEHQVPPTPFGDGLLCLSGTLRRLAAKSTGLGSASYPGLFDRPLWERSNVRPPGDTRAYQVVSRSSYVFGPCHTGFTTSNGVLAVWLP